MAVKLTWLPICVLAVAGCGGEKAATSDGASADGHKHVAPEPLENIIAKAKELGLPTTLDEFNAARTDRRDEAGAIYLKLAGLAQSEHVNMLERYLRGQATESEADRAVAGLAGEFRTMDAAVSKATFAPKRDYGLGMQVDYKEYDPMQKVCIAYSARAVRNARKGDIAVALADFRKAAAVARHASSEDVAMSEYLTTVCLDNWIRAATRAAESSLPLRPGLVQIAAELPTVDAKAGVGTDFVLIKSTIDRIRNGEVTYSQVAGFDSPAMVEGKPMDDMLKGNIDMAERYALSFVVRAYESWPDRAKVMELLHGAEHAAQEESSESTVAHAFEALAMTFTAPLKNGEGLTKAELECLLLAIAASDIKRKTGKAPTLAEAAVAAGTGETDPFSGKPYMLKDSEKGVTVYSVGLDLEDNGGKPYSPGEAQGTDIAVTL